MSHTFKDCGCVTIPGLMTIGMKAKLPKLYINKFSSNVTKFSGFWESFNSTVNKNPTPSAIDKFNYLKALLEGPAASAIQGLALSEGNYAAALELLQQGFGWTQQIISAHMGGVVEASML